MSGKPHPCDLIHLQAHGSRVTLKLFGLFSLFLVGTLVNHEIFSFTLYL